MKFANYLGAISLFALVAAWYVLNFSSVASKFQCTGELSTNEGKTSQSLFILLQEYRWWVGLWGDSDGAVELEIPNEYLAFYPHIIELGNQLQIYDRPGELHGQFSTLSKTLALNTPYGFFDGKCVAID